MINTERGSFVNCTIQRGVGKGRAPGKGGDTPWHKIRSQPFGVTKAGDKVTEYIPVQPGGLTVSVC